MGLRHGCSSARYVRTLVALCACLPCAACLTPPVAIEAQEAIVHASRWHRNEAREALEVVQAYTPLIQRILGVESERPVIFLLDTELGGDALGTFRSWDDERAILIGTEALPTLRTVLVHELVHWNAMTTRWKCLPHGLQQGLAYWLQLELVELRGKIQAWIDPPAPQLLHEVLTLSPEQYVDAEGESYRNSAALWIVAKLGLARLTELVERAEAERVTTVPAHWIEAAIPEPRDQRVEFLSLIELVYYDSQGAILRADVGSVSSSWTSPSPAGAVSMQFRALDLPAYDGPRMLVPGLAVEMPAPH